MPILKPPSQSTAYQWMCQQAHEAGLDQSFRALCMLLDAPSDMRCFLPVAATLRSMLDAVPDDWHLDEAFLHLREIADWAIQNRDRLNEKLEGRLNFAEARPEHVHPMFGFLTQHPIYGMLCNTQEVEDCRPLFLLLQLQVVVARRSELARCEDHSELSYIALYESNAADTDFAAGMRGPEHACLAVRALSKRHAAELVRFMQPWRDPGEFATLLRARDDIPVGPAFSLRIGHICNYCELKSHARGSYLRSSGERQAMPAMNCYGYFEYNDFRFGVDCDQGDPDDDLPGVPEHELIVDRTGRLDEALLSDEDPNEGAVGDLLLVRLRVPRKVVLLEEISKQTGPPHLDIDRECMPWSAIYLRPQEIRYTLLAALRSRASGETATEPAEAETCALIAVCLETGRSLEQALGLQYAKDPRGDITLLPAAGQDCGFRWVWKGIQPLYKTQPPHIDGLEVMRSEYLVNAVHRVADSLLCKWLLARKHPR